MAKINSDSNRIGLGRSGTCGIQSRSSPRQPTRALGLAVVLAAVSATAQSAGAQYKILEKISGPDGGYDYVRADAANSRVLIARSTMIMAIDLKTKAVTTGLAPGIRLHDALPVNDSAELLVSNGGSNNVVFADGKTGATIATVPAGNDPDAEVFDPHTGLVLVMNHQGGDITLVNPKTHMAAGTINVGGSLESGVVDGGGRAYVNIEDKNEIAVIDIAARKVVTHYKLSGCDGPTGLAYDAIDGLLIAACDGATDVVSAKTGKVVQTLPTGKGADGIAFDPARRVAFIPAGGDGKLAIVAFAKGKGAIVQTLKTQIGARTIGLDESTGRVYIPAAVFGPSATPGGHQAAKPGTFFVFVVGK